MPVDTSMYNTGQAKPVNPLELLGTVANVSNLAEQNKLLRGQQQAQQIAIDAAKIDLVHKAYDGLGTMIGSLAQDPRISGPQGRQVVEQYAQNAVQQGFITPQQAATALGTMPQDPSQIPQWLQNINVQIMDGQARFRAIYGEPGMISNGSQQMPVATSPLTGVRQIGAPIQQTLSPSERAQLVPGTNAQGQPTVTPAANILLRGGMNPMTAEPMAPLNRLSPAQGEGTAPVAPVERNPLATMAAGPDVPMGPPAGQVETQKELAVGSAQKLNEDRGRESTFIQDITPLEKAKDALVRLGPTGTGPGTEQINEVKSFLTSMGIIDPSQELKDFDEARKYLVQFARQAGDTNTNDKLAAAFAGNPSLGISNAAAVDVVKTAISLRRLQNAQIRAFDASGSNPADYAKWGNDFNASQDPVAYGFDMMDPAQRAKYVKGLDAKGKEKFIQSLRTAIDLGLVTPPGVQ